MTKALKLMNMSSKYDKILSVMDMKKKIIVINGTGGSGKDTFVEYCSKYARVLNFSAIDKVKEIAKIIGWQGTKSEKDRKFLSDLKRLTIDYNDMPFKSICDKIAEFEHSDDEVMFIHIREPEEIDKVVVKYGVQTLLIKRQGLENISSNAADANVDNYDYDYTIFNTNLEELDREAKKFITEIKNK